MTRVKYPHTMHLQFSPGVHRDDKLIESMDRFVGREVVVTEKMDGENSTLYADKYHARSLDSRHHPSRDWLKRFHGEIAYLIPHRIRICGENVYATHSIEYTDLLSYFYGFSAWRDDVALSWDDTLELFKNLSIVPAPELYRGPYDLGALVNLAVNLDTVHHEGFVVRVVDEVPLNDFDKLVAKWVRPGHVQTDEFWMHKEVVPNKLRS